MSLLQMSITAGVLILGIVLFRSLFLHRLPKRIMLILWEIAMIRLLVPLSIAVPLPDVRIPVLYKVLGASEVRAEKFGVQEWMKTETEVNAENRQTISEETVSEEPVWVDIGFWVYMVYLMGVLVMTSGSLFLYLRDSRILRESLPMPKEERKNLTGELILNSRDEKRLQKVNFRVSDRVLSPMTYGIFRPCIIFPKGMLQREQHEADFCILHELVHIKNHDNLKKLAAQAALCLHWFNPLIFLMHSLYSRDMELLCDETVIREKEESQKDYALTLLSMAEQRCAGLTMGSGFGKNAVEERIVAIMKFKKVSFIGIIAAVIAVTASLTVFITNSIQKEEAESTAYAGGETVSAAEYEKEILELQKSEEEIEILEAQLRAESEAEKIRQSKENISDSKDGWTKVQIDDATAVWIKDEYSLSDSEVQQVIENVQQQKKMAAAEAAEGNLSEKTKELIEETVKEYEEYGLSVEFTKGDYQLYFQGEPVYYFADNKKQDGDGFEGQVFSRPASDKNGYTAVVTKRDAEGKVTGLLHLAREEAEDYRDGVW